MGISGDDVDIGITIHADTAAEQTIDRINAKMALLRTNLASTAQVANTTSTQTVANFNTAIGAFQAYAAAVDASSARQVAAFRAEGQALSDLFKQMGATKQEIASLTASMDAMEKRAGAASIAVNNTAAAGGAATQGFTTSNFAIRRAATSFDGLAIAAAGGAFSLRSAAQETGGLAVGLLNLSGASLKTSVGIGALIAVGVTLIGVFDDLVKKSKQATDNLTKLHDAARGAASTNALRGSLDETNAAIEAAVAKRAALQAQVNSQQAALTQPGQSPIAIAQETIGQSQSVSQLSAQDDLIKRLRGQAADLLDDLNKKGPESIKALGDAERTLNEQTAEDVAKRTEGEFAARRVAAQNEFDEEKKRLDDLATAKGQSDSAVAAAQRRLNEQNAQIDQDEAQRNAEARAAREGKSIATLEATRIASAKNTQASLDEAIQASRDKRLISERQAIALRLSAAIDEINAEEQARLRASGQRSTSLTTELADTADPTKRAALTSQLKDESDKRTQIIADASAQRAKIQTDAAKQTADVSRQLRQEIEQLNVQALNEQGAFLEAAKIEVQKEFRDALLEATRAGDTDAVQAIQSRIRITLEQAQAKALEQSAGQAISGAQASNAQIAARAGAGQISASDAHDQTLANLEKERDAIGNIIPLLQRLAADLPGDPKAQADLERYTTQFVELNAKIAESEDSFHNLKVASVDALENGIAKGIEDSEDSTKSLGVTWVKVGQDIIRTIQQVTSQMLAQLAVQQLLKAIPIFGGSSDSSGVDSLIDGIVAQGVPGIQVIGDGKAGGGMVRGPGTGTSDSIATWLSNGEGVLTARAVARNGGESALNDLNSGRAFISRRRFASGGLVGATAQQSGRLRAASFSGQISLSPGLIADFMRSDAGVQIQMGNMQNNRRHVQSIVASQ